MTKIKIDRTANKALRRSTDLKRLSVFIEMKKKLNKRLMKLPAGNLKKLAKLNKLFDEIIDEEILKVKEKRGENKWNLNLKTRKLKN